MARFWQTSRTRIGNMFVPLPLELLRKEAKEKSKDLANMKAATNIDYKNPDYILWSGDDKSVADNYNKVITDNINKAVETLDISNLSVSNFNQKLAETAQYIQEAKKMKKKLETPGTLEYQLEVNKKDYEKQKEAILKDPLLDDIERENKLYELKFNYIKQGGVGKEHPQEFVTYNKPNDYKIEKFLEDMNKIKGDNKYSEWYTGWDSLWLEKHGWGTQGRDYATLVYKGSGLASSNEELKNRLKYKVDAYSLSIKPPKGMTKEQWLEREKFAIDNGGINMDKYYAWKKKNGKDAKLTREDMVDMIDGSTMMGRIITGNAKGLAWQNTKSTKGLTLNTPFYNANKDIINNPSVVIDVPGQNTKTVVNTEDFKVKYDEIKKKGELQNNIYKLSNEAYKTVKGLAEQEGKDTKFLIDMFNIEPNNWNIKLINMGIKPAEINGEPYDKFAKKRSHRDLYKLISNGDVEVKWNDEDIKKGVALAIASGDYSGLEHTTFIEPGYSKDRIVAGLDRVAFDSYTYANYYSKELEYSKLIRDNLPFNISRKDKKTEYLTKGTNWVFLNKSKNMKNVFNSLNDGINKKYINVKGMPTDKTIKGGTFSFDYDGSFNLKVTGDDLTTDDKSDITWYNADLGNRDKFIAGSVGANLLKETELGMNLSNAERASNYDKAYSAMGYSALNKDKFLTTEILNKKVGDNIVIETDLPGTLPVEMEIVGFEENNPVMIAKTGEGVLVNENNKPMLFYGKEGIAKATGIVNSQAIYNEYVKR